MVGRASNKRPVEPKTMNHTSLPRPNPDPLSAMHSTNQLSNKPHSCCLRHVGPWARLGLIGLNTLYSRALWMNPFWCSSVLNPRDTAFHGCPGTISGPLAHSWGAPPSAAVLLPVAKGPAQNQRSLQVAIPPALGDMCLNHTMGPVGKTKETAIE